MTLIRPLLAAALLAGTAAQARPAPEDVIAKALAGRVAGTPTDCLYQRDIRSTEIVDRTAILYRMNNGTIYLNRPRSGANFLNWGVALVTNTYNNRLCSVDIVRLLDTTIGMQTGTVGLGDFVPYAKPGKS